MSPRRLIGMLVANLCFEARFLHSGDRTGFIVGIGTLAEQPPDQIAGIVKHEDHRLQHPPAELADFLSRLLTTRVDLFRSLFTFTRPNDPVWSTRLDGVTT